MQNREEIEKLSDEQRRVLKRIAKAGRASAYDCRASVTTFQVLERRGLISVETTLGSIAFPRQAAAHLTPKATALLSGSEA